ncbi:MAG TPA: HAD family hydrolase [Gaiellaceae bacterium]|jgi:HAD superfamily hydrolase (TIGR01509 family)|nr:HAD family hydrolase [Gaiellaceae bacterium]
MARVSVLDLDGTLVDTNYHHAVAWHRAFGRHGIVLPVWRLHRHVGMGGDKFVAAVAGEDVERRLGDRVRAEWEALFDEMIGEVEPLAGARELVRELKARGHSVVLASSAIQSHFDAFVDKLGVRDLADAWATNDDVDASKPDPDLVEAALEKAGSRDAVMVGDTPWDVEAARRAGIDTLCVLTGGFAEAELRDAGALAVFESVDALRERLDETPLA